MYLRKVRLECQVGVQRTTHVAKPVDSLSVALDAGTEAVLATSRKTL